MQIELKPEQEELVKTLIKQGRFASPADVVSASLELILSEHDWNAHAQQRIDAGADALKQGDFAPDGSLEQLFARYKLK